LLQDEDDSFKCPALSPPTPRRSEYGVVKRKPIENQAIHSQADP
jgi:hypothetical protein